MVAWCFVFCGFQAPLMLLSLALYHFSILVASISKAGVVHMAVFWEDVITVCFDVVQGFRA